MTHREDEQALPGSTDASVSVSAGSHDVTPGDADFIVESISRQYARFVEHYHKHVSDAPQDAVASARTHLNPEERTERALSRPAKDLTWGDFSHLVRNVPEAAKRRWVETKEQAHRELESGHRAALAVSSTGDDSPYDRAEFIALRESLMDEWQPRGGIEQSLIDLMAQALTCHNYWLNSLMVYTHHEAAQRKADWEKFPSWEPRRVSEFQGIEQAAAMVDRFNKLYLRTLRQLRDLRRYSPQVTIQNAGQVNIAGGQQTNLAKVEAVEAGDVLED